MNAPASAASLNDAQRAALDLSRDMLVSAGAGAGKTQVLGLRVLAILEEGLASVSEIVAFTFTEKAAAEMRERVQRLLLDRIAELADGDKERLARLKKAQAEFARNRVSTVHGFCHRLLRDYAWEAGLEPRAPILDERAQALARERAIRRVLFQTDASEQPELARALVRLGAVVRLYSLTGSLNDMLRRRAFVRGPLQRAAEAWADPETELQRRREQYDGMVGEFLDATIEAVNAIDFGAAGGAKDSDKLRTQVFRLRDAAGSRDLQTLVSLLLNKDGSPSKPGGSKGNWKHDPDGLERVREQVTAAAMELSAAGDVLSFRFDDELERRIGRVACDLHVVFEALCEAYTEECAGGLDFLDLELRALQLLRDEPGVRREAIRAAKYMLVDEYQDTNPTQAELFSLLTDDADAPGRFFAVGDAKQSIYAFRGSDVRVFNHALEWIPERNANSGANRKPMQPPWGMACDDTPERRSGIVRLEYNYRTVKPVLDLGNEVFRNVLAREEYRDFDARPQDMLFDGNTDKPADTDRPVEFHVLPDANAAMETEYVARQVERLIDEGVAPSDITILVRRGSRNALYRNAFARRNVPLLVVGEGGLFETQEALDCINLLRVLANPRDDVAVLGLMRSPFGGLSDRLLTDMSLRGDRHLSLLERLKAWDDKPPEARLFIERLEALRERAGRDAPALLLGEALSDFGYLLAVGCGPDAAQRMANVARMLELVRGMQHEIPSLAPLVRELVDRIEREEDEAQGVPDRSVEGVRLMTIHKAKGLEFKVVILPDLAASPGGGDTGIVRDLPEEEGEPLGLYLRSLDEADRGKYRSDFAAWRAKYAGRERGAAEEKRVLYVAWTRASHRLLLIGSLKQGKEFDRDVWAHQLLRALNVRDWNGEGGHDCLAMHWPDEIEPSDPVPHTAAIENLRRALDAGELVLPREIDDSLVAPIAEPAARPATLDPEAAEFGALVHAELERSFRGVEMGMLDARAVGHVRRAVESLATLGKARRVLPEYGIMTPEGPRRLDLLRELGDGRYEIIDYKTDNVHGDLQEHAERHHGEQLRGYARALTGYLALRGQEPSEIRLLVCFTAPDDLRPEQRLVEIRG
ncbi:MAG: UvrD-helicase domain-containing protein [Planctomycetes bacterium]|nr:UvrD-helicase domain-containing protein [Planctomycetota bacterium]